MEPVIITFDDINIKDFDVLSTTTSNNHTGCDDNAVETDDNSDPNVGKCNALTATGIANKNHTTTATSNSNSKTSNELGSSIGRDSNKSPPSPQAPQRHRRKQQQQQPPSQHLHHRQNSVEDIFDKANLTYNCGIIYPPNPKFIDSYRCWHQHQAIMWSSHETHPELDRDSFKSLDHKFQLICLKMIAFLMWGDSIVIDIMEQNIVERITAREVRAFIADQIARENIHQEVYSKMLDVTTPDESDYYRSEDFRREYLSRFEALADTYRKQQDSSAAVFFYFVMLCECIMFAPMFQTVCYMAYNGSTPILGSVNFQVMRDEALHYKHARCVLSKLKHKLPLSTARKILTEFMNLVDSLLVETIGDYKSNDGLYSLDICRAHFNHVCAGFMRENSLFITEQEATSLIEKYRTTPAQLYMDLAKREVKSNLMESQSTIYAIGEGGGGGTNYNNDDPDSPIADNYRNSSSRLLSAFRTLTVHDMSDW